MTDQRTGPIFFFAPFVSSTMRIEPSWIDYNGHMNMAYYHVLFDRAADEAFELVGLGPDYRSDRKASYFAAEVHTLYRRELRLGDPVRVTVQLLDFDDKRLHSYLEIRHATEGWVAATSENLAPCRCRHAQGDPLPGRHPDEPGGHEGGPRGTVPPDRPRPRHRHSGQERQDRRDAGDRDAALGFEPQPEPFRP